MHPSADISLLKQALPYIKQFRNKVFVIKFGGEVVSEPSRIEAIAEQVALLHELNIRLVIIHGGGPQLSETASLLGIETKKIGGRRVTCDSMLQVAKMVFAGGISTDILAALRKFGTPGVGLSGVDGGLIEAVRRPPRRVYDDESGEELEVDFQNVGDVRGVRPEVIEVLLEKRFVPVIASLGCDDEGHVLNINADTIAAEVAAALRAEKLFLFTNIDGVLRDVNDLSSRYSYLTVEQTEAMVEKHEIYGGMAPKLVSAASAVTGGVRRAHILNGLSDNALLYEVFTVAGTGTMILTRDEEKDYLARLDDAHRRHASEEPPAHG